MHGEHWLFVQNVFAHLVASMSGIASFIFSLWEHARNKKIEAWAFFVVGLLCLIIAFDQAWQDEHSNVKVLIGEKSVLWQERDFWKEQSYQKDFSLRTRDDLLGKNYQVLAQTQSSLSALSAELVKSANIQLKITNHFLGLVPSQLNSNVHAAHAGTFIVLTNKTVTPIRLLVSCESRVVQATGAVLGTGVTTSGGWGGRVTKSDKDFGIGMDSPAWTPTNPMLVTIYTDERSLGICSFDQK